jgi:hypothetical protein
MMTWGIWRAGGDPLDPLEPLKTGWIRNPSLTLCLIF